MKGTGILRNAALGLAMALGGALAPRVMKTPQAVVGDHPRRPGKNTARTNKRSWTRSRSVPQDRRHWHNPKEPRQMDRVEEALNKRVRRADKLIRDQLASWAHNSAHNSNWSLYPFTPNQKEA